MKRATTFTLLSGSILMGMTTTVLADEHDGAGVQTAIDQHNINIQRFENQHPEKDLPRGLLHSRDVLEKIQAGEKPERPEFARPERPEMPNVAMQAERPETPHSPDKPNNGRH